MPKDLVSNCDWCGSEFDQLQGVGRPRKFCRQSHKVRSSRWRRHVGVRVSLIEIAQRCNFRCARCGEDVDMSLPGSDPRGATIDHEVPQAAGGAPLAINLQLMHRACNSEKRDRLPFVDEELPVADLQPGDRVLVGTGQLVLTVESIDTWHGHTRVWSAGIDFPLLIPQGEMARRVPSEAFHGPLP